jgi:hypothetical protein
MLGGSLPQEPLALVNDELRELAASRIGAEAAGHGLYEECRHSQARVSSREIRGC